jgi:Ca2+-binding EF-hand superfamily protein
MEIVQRLKARIPLASFEEFEAANDGFLHDAETVSEFALNAWLAAACVSSGASPLTTGELERLCQFLGSHAGQVSLKGFHKHFTSKMAQYIQRRTSVEPAESDSLATADNVRDLALALCDADAFRHIDTDGDGLLSPWELQLWLAKTGVSIPEQLFHSLTANFDQNSDGGLDVSEFLQLGEVLRENAQLASIDVPSSTPLAEDASESLSHTYTQHMQSRVAAATAAAAATVQPAPAVAVAAAESSAAVDPDFLRQVALALPAEAFEQLDANGDGYVSPFEMASWLARGGLEMAVRRNDLLRAISFEGHFPHQRFVNVSIYQDKPRGLPEGT